jgi:short-chain fatty acids transporter
MLRAMKKGRGQRMGLTHAAIALGRFSAWVVPSAFAIAVLLTVFVAIIAITWGQADASTVLSGWGEGFWLPEMLTFAMQMALVLFTGYLLALAPPVRKALEALARLPRSPRSAVAMMALTSMALGYLNWGLSIVGSAVLVRHVAKRQPDVDYRLLVACAYFGLGATWHAGLSASAPLLVATPKNFLESQIGVLPIDRTLFSTFNLVLVAVTVVVLTGLAYWLHPQTEHVVRVDPALLREPAPEPEGVPSPGLAGWLDQSRGLNVLFFSGALAWVLARLSSSATAFAGLTDASAAETVLAVVNHGWRFLNINLVIFVLLGLSVLLHRTPAAVVKASEEAASVLSGIALQFPLYAGIYGIFRATGLAPKLGELFVSLCTAKSFPTVVYWYSGLVNYFVPSGGAKWTIEAPYLLSAAQTLGVAPEKVVMAYAWGDMATDLIQPFWAIPLLAVAKLEFKDVLGFLLLAFCVYAPLVTLAFWLWG